MVAWLGGWGGKRYKIVVDSGDVDGNLTWFPIRIALNNACGISSFDATDIFTDLGANKLKIACTKDDGTTEIYVEVDNWDNGGGTADLWVSKSDLVVLAASDTTLYLYYDAAHANNTTYVGIPNDVVSESVWNAEYVLVDHMNDDPGTSNTRDSTSNDNDGTKTGAAEPAVTTSGKIGDAQTFDGIDDEIAIANNAGIVAMIAGSFTLSTWFKPTNNFPAGEADDNMLIARHNSRPAFFLDKGTGKLYFTNFDGVDTVNTVSVATTWIAGTWYYGVATYDGVNQTLYVDGVLVDQDAQGNPNETGQPITFGARFGGSLAFAGVLDEGRFSNTNRDVNWVKASYESERDDLVTVSGPLSTPDESLYYYKGLWPNYYAQKRQATVLPPEEVDWKQIIPDNSLEARLKRLKEIEEP